MDITEIKLRTYLCLSLLGISVLPGVAGVETVERKAVAVARSCSFGRSHLTDCARIVHTEFSAGVASWSVVQNEYDAPGFVIVSADADSPVVLGWVDNAEFIPDSVPESMRWMLGEIMRSSNPLRRVTPAHEEWCEIEPLMSAKWNQDAPYFNSTPQIMGQHTWTGCGATALAQIFYHHKWPEHAYGTGVNRLYGTDIDLTEYSFDWDSMLPIYNEGEYDDIQANAVAQLMSACGYALKMQYSTSVSLCSTYEIERAIIENFHYGPGVELLFRDYIDDDKFISAIYDDLSDGNPVFFGGVSGAGGHAFVADGYKDGYFHINWGWSGLYDGWFSLGNLNPEGQGIGGYEGEYNSTQHIITGIRPNYSEEIVYPQTMLTKGDFKEYAKGYWVYSTGVGIELVNNCHYFYVEAVPAIKICSLDNQDSNAVYVASSSGFEKFGTTAGFKYITADFPSDLPDGGYSISGCLLDADGNEHPIYQQPGRRKNVTALVSDGKAKIYNQSTLPENTSVESIAEEASCQPQFFSLEGIPVSNPERGNLYIVKKGGSVEKIIY